VLIIGIDPGLDGAIAAIDTHGSFITVFDVPTFTLQGNKGKKKRTLDLRGTFEILEGLADGKNCTAYIELVHSMPKQGVRSMFTLGETFGALKMALAALKIPFEEITPQRWKKVMLHGMPKDKDASRYKAQQLFPSAPLTRKKDHNRADALLIARYGLKMFHKYNFTASEESLPEPQ